MSYPKEYYTGEYFGPDNLTDEWRGYFEDLEELGPYRFLGSRPLTELPLGRLPGAQWAIETTLSKTVELQKGHKKVLVKASAKRPLRVRSTIGIVGGRPKEKLAE